MTTEHLIADTNTDDSMVDSTLPAAPASLLTTGLVIQADLKTILTGFFLSVIILFTLVGNALVVTAVVSYRRLRSVTNYFVVSLAVADLTVAILVLPYSVVYEISGSWRFGWIFCYFWISCDVTCCTASILHLCVISLDRYLAVTEPLTYRSRMSRRRALLAIAAVWSTSMAISFVPIYMGWFVDSDQMTLYVDGPVCGLHVNKIYAVISSMTSFYLPLVVMAIVYAKIYRIAKQQAEEIKQLERSLGLHHQQKQQPIPDHTQQLHQHQQQATPEPHHAINRLQNRSRRVNNDSKAIKTLGTLMGLFCSSWLPFFLMYLIVPFCESCRVPPAAESAITWLGYCNSFINPCVYAFLNRDFRIAFKKILLCGGGSRDRFRPTTKDPPSGVDHHLRPIATAAVCQRRGTSQEQIPETENLIWGPAPSDQATPASCIKLQMLKTSVVDFDAAEVGD